MKTEIKNFISGLVKNAEHSPYIFNSEEQVLKRIQNIKDSIADLKLDLITNQEQLRALREQKVLIKETKEYLNDN